MIFVVAIGSNMARPFESDSPLKVCRDAAAALDRLDDLRVRGLSRWYRSAPIPPSGQPDFVNGVALLTGHSTPERFLAALQAIEHSFGRVRGAPNAARTLDLDIVAIDDMVRNAPDPVLPHPRAHLRAFVLLPLRDVRPDWVDPLTGRPLDALIADLPVQDIGPL